MGSGPLCDAYRERRLLESHLETAALKNGLSLQEAQVLLSLDVYKRQVEVSTSDQLVKKAFSTVSSYIFLILQ